MTECPHCQTSIEEHKATRCLDAWVAEAVMGWRTHRITDRVWVGKSTDNLIQKSDWEPSTSIMNAWEVVDILTSMDWMVFTGTNLKDGSYCRLEWHDPFDPKWEQFMSRDSSVPLAICRVALEAISQ